MRFVQEKALFTIFILIMNLFAISLFNTAPVAAQIQDVCCERTLSDEFCAYTDSANCNPDYQSDITPCENTNFCRSGCCIDTTDGFCYNNIGAAECISTPDTTFVDTNCLSVPDCQRGCCQLGNQCTFTTEANCDYLAQEYTEFERGSFNEHVVTERACLDQCREIQEGCCIHQTGLCAFTTETECPTLGLENEQGDLGFYASRHCSDPSLSCTCQPHTRKGCAPEDDDVHWFDSCGNKEEIVEDCDYNAGTICKEQDGNAFCASVNCEDTIKGFRYNGESWCQYEGKVGPSNDLVGSRHYQQLCINGEILTAPCADFRDEACIEYIQEENGEKLLHAECVPNRWEVCVETCNDEYNSPAENKYCCDKQLTCYWTGSETEGLCLPITPPGLAFWDNPEEQRTPARNAQDVCDLGDKTCVSVHVKKSIGGSYECEANCECEEPSWPNTMNAYCRSLGDCGAHYSINGAFSDEGIITSGPRTYQFNSQDYESFEAYWNNPDITLNIGEIPQNSNTEANHHYRNFFELTIKKNPEILFFVGTPYGTPTSAFFAALSTIIIFDFLTFGWLSQIIQQLFGVGKTRKYDHIINCEPWVAPPGGDRCHECSEKFEAQCTQYKCRSYGSTCQLVNEGTQEATCLDIAPNDVSTPLITPLYDALTPEHTIELTQQGYYITHDTDVKIKPVSTLTFGIATNEHAQCKYSLHDGGIPYQEMITYFGTPNYALEHNITFFTEGSTDYNFYVKCTDKKGNANIKDYAIQFSTSAEPDITPPGFIFTDPDVNAKLPYDTTEILATFYLTEPVQECRFSTQQDVPYENMLETSSDRFACPDNFQDIDPTYNLFTCLYAMPIAQLSNNIAYIKCKDLAGNVNAEDFIYNLVSTPALDITSAQPQGTLFATDTNLIVHTANGADQGRATCTFLGTFTNNNHIEFFTTNANQHAHSLQNLGLGDYHYDIRCIDSAENIATADIDFTIDVDTYAPQIINVYAQGPTNIIVITDEPSTCVYSTSTRTFNFNQGTPMIGAGQEHSLQEYATRYYIKCQDVDGNEMKTTTIYR